MIPGRGPARAGRFARHGRVAVLTASAAATAVAVLGTAGLVGSAATPSPGSSASLAAEQVPAATPARASSPSPVPLAPAPVVAAPTTEPVEVEPPVPAGSGQGRRAVFDQSEQRVWLVGGNGQVRRTYLVSGSVYDNLDPGTYEVFSRSAQAWGIDDSGQMTHFVRFTRGDNAAIGFHAIPTKDGRPLQGLDELGTATSHGCIRQATPDAKAMWRFAQLGDTVVVTA